VAKQREVIAGTLKKYDAVQRIQVRAEDPLQKRVEQIIYALENKL
jgi:hypothetical protein